MARERYSVEEAAAIVGLSPNTLRQYPFVTDLVRGDDYYVSRFARFRKRTWWTARGIARLKTRAYHVRRSDDYKHAPVYRDDGALPRGFTRSVQEMHARIGNRINLAFSRYLNSPCAVPSCPCMTHRLGLPQADEIAAVMELKAAARKKR